MVSPNSQRRRLELPDLPVIERRDLQPDAGVDQGGVPRRDAPFEEAARHGGEGVPGLDQPDGAVGGPQHDQRVVLDRRPVQMPPERGMLDGDVLFAGQSEERVDPVDPEVAQGAAAANRRVEHPPATVLHVSLRRAVDQAEVGVREHAQTTGLSERAGLAGQRPGGRGRRRRRRPGAPPLRPAAAARRRRRRPASRPAQAGVRRQSVAPGPPSLPGAP